MESRLREVVMKIVEKCGDNAKCDIAMRDWPIEVKEEALAMLETIPPEAYMVEMGELDPSELEQGY